MAKVDPIAHGGDLGAIARTYSTAPTPWVDLSTGINPWSYPQTDSAPNLNGLPSNADVHACRESMAYYLGCASEAITLMPGSQIGISLLPHLMSPSSVVIAGPTYEEHAHSWRSAGHNVDVLSLFQAQSTSADIIIVVHPNNPDGTVLERAAFDGLRQRQAARGGWLIVDEAFGDLSPSESYASHAGADGLIVLRSFGKFFGLAGLRLGALLSPASLRARVEQAIGPWAVSTQALHIGAQAYQDAGWINDMRGRLNSRAQELATILRHGELEIIGGTDLFCLALHAQAPALFMHLAQAGLYVRQFDAHPTWLRFGLPADIASLARLKQALSTFGDI
ncbi:MAG: threonine-phosphate decarboxylase CobD [Parvibaculaceae bacterium]|nr:threonine-phosphate decarboxylase CobD [Parvibaculaceae bacterium]